MATSQLDTEVPVHTASPQKRAAGGADTELRWHAVLSSEKTQSIVKTA